MKQKSTWVVVLVTITVTTLLNTRIGAIPPIGKFLDPLQGMWQNAENKAVPLPSSLTLPGLKEQVAIRLDQERIPHITAKNDLDLHFAQGYITAFHRLWQMDMLTYTAAGRLAEILGPQFINFDRLQRRKGNGYAAYNTLAQLKKDPKLYKLVEAYVAGINAYIHALNHKNLPIEYKLLDYRPEPWTPLKVALMMVKMTDDLCGNDRSVENTNTFHQLGRAKFDFLFPAYPTQAKPVIPKKAPPGHIPPQLNRHPTPVHQRPIESNNWAVASQKTAAGTPYLANAPHLTMHLPSIWYAIHLQSPKVNVLGGSIPGLPGVLVGFNEALAWGTTNTAHTVRNWYVIDFKDDTRREYYYENLLLKTQQVTEKIRVRGGDTVYDTVVYTHFGPIVYDADFPGYQGTGNLAMKWAGHQPGQELLAFYLLNRAKNLQEFEQALQYYNVPGQYFSFASVSNDIAMQLAGRFPLLQQGQGKFIMPGNTAAYEWQSFSSQSHNPRIINPASGYVSPANQRATAKGYHYQAEDYGNRRASQVLSNFKRVDEKAIMQLQTDNYNLAAQESLPLLLQHVDTNQLTTSQHAAYQLLSEWDFYNKVDQVAPSIFSAWQHALQNRLWHSLQHKEWPMPTPDFYRTMDILKNQPTSPHLDLGGYDSLAALVHAAFVAGLQALETWQAVHQKPYRWGDYRPVFINHLAAIPAFGVKNLQIDGGSSLLNNNEDNRGASMRLIVQLGKQPQGWLVYPGGQSGNPGSPYYSNMIPLWCQRRYIPVTLQGATKAPEGEHHLTLKPER